VTTFNFAGRGNENPSGVNGKPNPSGVNGKPNPSDVIEMQGMQVMSDNESTVRERGYLEHRYIECR